jgi:hypothetical protein
MKSQAEQREARGKVELHSARSGNFSRTYEPSEAPDHDDAVKEKVATASKGSKSGKKKSSK